MAHQRAPALFLTLLLHMALFALWQQSRHHEADAPADTALWLTLLSARSVPAIPPAKPLPPQPKRQQLATRPAPAQSMPLVPAAPAIAPPPPETAEDKESPTPVVAPLESSAPSAADIMKQARRDLAEIDRAIREAEAKWVRAPPSSQHSRMQAAFDEAKQLAPPRWYEAAKIIPLLDQSGKGRRIYKVITGMGTYCITRGTNHSVDDSMKNGIQQTYGQCPK